MVHVNIPNLAVYPVPAPFSPCEGPCLGERCESRPSESFRNKTKPVEHDVSSHFPALCCPSLGVCWLGSTLV